MVNMEVEMSQPERSEPTEEEFIDLHMRFARSRAKTEYDIRYSDPRRARETAHAWVGMIELMVMGSSQGYTRAFSTPYQPLFDDGRYPVPFNVFLLLPDGNEHETSRITTRIVAVFPTEAAATQWVQTLAAELQGKHDRNHARQCRDKACARRGHTWQPRLDED
ncbi:hypothetical protein HZA87_00440 [Candidatus Uhrbacteria bacterium]|nr:hypothetical protein [Candidatus Uhrbacteria bacterium]